MKKYETEIRVIYADTDAMGIVYHTNQSRNSKHTTELVRETLYEKAWERCDLWTNYVNRYLF